MSDMLDRLHARALGGKQVLQMRQQFRFAPEPAEPPALSQELGQSSILPAPIATDLEPQVAVERRAPGSVDRDRTSERPLPGGRLAPAPVDIPRSIATPVGPAPVDRGRAAIASAPMETSDPLPPTADSSAPQPLVSRAALARSTTTSSRVPDITAESQPGRSGPTPRFRDHFLPASPPAFSNLLPARGRDREPNATELTDRSTAGAAWPLGVQSATAHSSSDGIWASERTIRQAADIRVEIGRIDVVLPQPPRPVIRRRPQPQPLTLKPRREREP